MGRKSSIDQLDPAIRKRIDALLKDNQHTLEQILEQINQAFPSAKVPSRSSLGRYSQRFDEVAKKLRDSRAVAEVWADRLGSEPQGDVGKVVLELLRTVAFQSSLEASETAEGVSGKELSQLALAMQRIEAAGQMSLKREQAVTQAALAEAAKVADKAVKKAGLTPETAEAIKRQILGIGA